MMFFLNPLVRRTAGFSTTLLTVAVMAMVSTGAIAYVVRSIKIAGRAEVEMRQLVRINEENRKASERQRSAIVTLERAQSQARLRLAELREQAGQEQRAIDEIEANGEGVICPVDCQLP